MGLIIDSCVLVTLERHHAGIEGLLRDFASAEIGICAITAAELFYGVVKAATEERKIYREAFLDKVLGEMIVYPFDLGAALIYGRLWPQLKQKGLAVGTHDLQIASTCISIGFSLLTENIRDFQKIQGLQVGPAK